MTEEVVGVIESGESGGSLKEGVTEADVQRVQENARQAKKVAQQLQQNKKENNKLAKFLSYLLTEINNEKIIKGLYDTFFITIDPRTNIPYFRKSMNDIVVVGLFYPFFIEKANETGVAPYYEKLNSSGIKTIEGYITYLQELSDKYHDNIPINQNSFIDLLVEILKEYLPTNFDPNSTIDINQEYKKIINEKLYLGLIKE